MKAKPNRCYSIVESFAELPKITLSWEQVEEVVHKRFPSLPIANEDYQDRVRELAGGSYHNSAWVRLYQQYFTERLTYVREARALCIRYGEDGHGVELSLEGINTAGDLLRAVLTLCRQEWATPAWINFF